MTEDLRSDAATDATPGTAPTPPVGVQVKIALLVTAALWVCSAGLLVFLVGLSMGGGLSLSVAILPAFAILLGVPTSPSDGRNHAGSKG